MGTKLCILSLAAPLVAVVCRRIGERPTSILGAGLVSGGCLLSTQATSVPFLCVSMGLLLGEWQLP